MTESSSALLLSVVRATYLSLASPLMRQEIIDKAVPPHGLADTLFYSSRQGKKD
jgi:hypothetical protein